MALLNGQNVCDTVAFRVSNRIAANSTGAGSIIECANLALGLISSAASWEWDQTSITVATPSDSYTLTGGDTGKEIAVFNSVNGTRIERAKTSDAYSASTGYVNSGGAGGLLYNTYRLSVDSGGGTYDPNIVLFPSGVSGNIKLIYHLVPPVLTYGAAPTVKWTVKAMDMVLIDLTEAYVKKVLGMAGWETTWSDCIKRISEFKTTYSAQRENTGPADETEESSKEKMMGRD